MRQRVFGFLFLVAWGMVLGGCGPLPPSTPEMFFGNCIMVPGRDLCGSDRDICQAFQTVVTDTHASAKACRDACNQAAASLGMQYLSDDCSYTIGRGNNLCEQQCLRLYPKPEK